MPARAYFYGKTDAPLGQIHQAELTKALLDAGVAVIAPEAAANGHMFWYTNQPGWSALYHLSPDYKLFQNLFQAIDEGRFGPLRKDRIAAAGMSSGGFNSSRLALEFPERVRSIIVLSGGYAKHPSINTFIPDLPQDHAATLVIHGEKDHVVDSSIPKAFSDKLVEQGIESELYIAPGKDHEFIPGTGERVVAWLRRTGIL
jgi:dienelactone hydrolase